MPPPAQPFDPIVVPFDGSPPARAAAALARRIATGVGSRLVLVHALEDPRDALARERAEALLGLEALEDGPPVETRLVEGPAPGTLALFSDTLGAGLVVLGTRGRAPLEGVLLGSTARWFLRASTRPVLVVHRDVAAEHILAAVEEGPAATGIAAAARVLAGACAAGLTFATVMPTDPAVARSPRQYGIDPQLWRDAEHATAERVFGPLRRADAPRASELLLVGIPALALTALAVDHPFGVVVVGRKGSTGRDVDAWGSVAYTLASRGPFATLVL